MRYNYSFFSKFYLLETIYLKIKQKIKHLNFYIIRFHIVKYCVILVCSRMFRIQLSIFFSTDAKLLNVLSGVESCAPRNVYSFPIIIFASLAVIIFSIFSVSFYLALHYLVVS